ncbi:hypothetical protein HELRODRAFT_65151 [Helobdella robusta]|uniref:Gluconokinase n=1 Tax=Helobdella robusta TaxID=6412 RepID=T1FY37_HELRO|nr:hypothetical protein HELRODRAFT_65151 [Helobdella robusta]ESO02485.1 hypothetical protein HELRODRAFT_65151 [Helobdella robusta]
MTFLKFSTQLGWRFIDADDLHTVKNVEKMLKGVPLNDRDRYPWLLSIHHLMKQACHENSDIIIACSALKNSYRNILISKITEDKTSSNNSSLENVNLCKSVIFFHLQGSIELIGERVSNRKNHFMSANLLQSQFDTLELPTTTTDNNVANQFEYVCIDICESPTEIASKIINHLTVSKE